MPASNAGGHRFESDPPLLDAPAIAACIAVLDALRDLAPSDPRFVAVERAAAHLHKAAKKKRRLARKHEHDRVDRELVASAGRAAAYFAGPAAGPPAGLPAGLPAGPPAGLPAGLINRPRVLHHQRRCYVCKQPFRRVHAFYHALCPSCAERNYLARSDQVDLTGRRALVTGGRVKIGFEVARALAQAGAAVTVTTRFPRDAARRYAQAGLGDRVEIVGLDLRDLPGVLGWIDRELSRARPLDILINNAAQTVRRPPAYYASLVAAELAALAPGGMPGGPGVRGGPASPPSADLAEELREALVFPPGVDEEGQPLDLRARNSWVLEAADVPPVELVEVHVINAIAPFLLASRLRPLFARSAFADRYIVNVSAMEGVFAYPNKQPRHPHTNMAKAALNMFTRTSATDYLRDGIYMNSVDTGWITQENPAPRKRRVEAAGFCPPLDIVDGAARVLAPILRGVRGAPVAGVLFKDYEPTAW